MFLCFYNIFFYNFAKIISNWCKDLSFFQNIFNKILGKEEEDKEEKGLLEYGDQLKNTDLDYKFAQLFTLSGGIFNYCGNEAEALSVLQKIIKAENIHSVFCCDEDLQKFLNVTQTPYTSHLNPKNNAAFLTCEYLIAYDGKIMLSYENILHYNSLHLPEKIIIMATISQIVENSSKAMMKIKRRNDLVKNLTSISGGKSQLDYSDKKNTKIFLLLLED